MKMDISWIIKMFTNISIAMRKFVRISFLYEFYLKKKKKKFP